MGMHPSFSQKKKKFKSIQQNQPNLIQPNAYDLFLWIKIDATQIQ